MFESFRLDSLNFSYRENEPILKGVYLEVKAGEVVGILGRNGCGKSTLFGCLTHFKRVEGQFFLNGTWLDPRRRSAHIGWLPQASFLPASEPVGRLVRHVLKDKAARELVLQDKRLSGLLKAPCRALSGGEARWLEFLLVDGLNRPLTILDEPFSELEPLYQEAMIAHIQAKQDGRAWLVSDHNYRAVGRVATRVLLLSQRELKPVNGEADLIRLGYTK